MSLVQFASNASDSPGRRAIDLMQEAQAAGNQQIAAFLRTLELSCRQAAEIAAGGEAYPAGVRDLAARLADHTAHKAQSIYSIMRVVRSGPHHEFVLSKDTTPPAVDLAS